MYRLLIVEDEDIIRQGISKIIQDMALPLTAILEARSGSEAMALARSERVDMVISDIRMERGDGLSLIRQLREEGLCRHFIIISGYGEFAYAQQAISLGVSEYLLKPVKKKNLADALGKLLGLLEQEQEQAKIAATNHGLLTTADHGLVAVADHTQGLEGFNRIRQDLGTLPHAPESNAISFILQYMEHHYDQNITLKSAADRIYMNASYFSTLFRKKTGITFIHYLQKLRIERAKELLLDPQYKIYEVAVKVGFVDEKYFFKVFKNCEGVTPNEYRDNRQRRDNNEG